MLTDEQVSELASAMAAGSSLRDAVRDVTHQEPSLQLLTWLRNTHYELLTDAKKGDGFTKREAEARQMSKGN